MAVTDRRYPEDSDTVLHIRLKHETLSFADLRERISSHFKTEAIDDFEIEIDEIQECCFGHDQYDSGDYGDYLIIRKEGT